MANFTDAQKQNIISELSAVSAVLIEAVNRAKESVERWQMLGITPTDFIASGVLNNTAFEGLPDSVLSNMVGSIDGASGDLNDWFTTHGDNLRLMVK